MSDQYARMVRPTVFEQNSDGTWKYPLMEPLRNIARDTANAIAESAREGERERCALIAVSFGEFPGSKLIKDMRVMCGNAIADKIRETAQSPGKTDGAEQSPQASAEEQS